MKVLVYSVYAHATPHFETELEIIQNHLDAGDEVYVLLCDTVLENCMWNPEHQLGKCASCQSRAIHGLNRVGVDKDHILHLRNFEEVNNVEFGHFDSLNALKEWEMEGIDFGFAAASTLISQLRAYELSSATHGPVIERSLRMALNVYYNFKTLLPHLGPDRVYIFNGRFADQRPVLRLCQQWGIECLVHERGANMHKYDLFENELPHSTGLVHRKILQAWEAAPADQRESSAAAWYLQRKQGVEQNWKSFTAGQAPNQLPEGFDPKVRNITFFNSSEDEYKGIGGWENPLFDDQNDSIREIVRHFQGRKGLHFYLRVHPNLGEVESTQMEEIQAMDFPNLTVIGPDASVDSYFLLDSSDAVVTFASTMGVEATFWGIPSILVGPAFYGGLDCVHIPDTREELFALIEQPLRPKPKLGALKYAWWNATKGIKFKHFQPSSLFTGTFKGKIVGNEFVMRMVKRLQKIPPFSGMDFSDKFYRRCLHWMKCFG